MQPLPIGEDGIVARWNVPINGFVGDEDRGSFVALDASSCGDAGRRSPDQVRDRLSP